MCERGKTTEVIIEGKSISVDSCIAKEVGEINKKGHIKTLGSCCGHFKYPKTIIVEIKETGTIVEYYSGIIINRKRNFYYKDEEGIFRLPEQERLNEYDVREKMEKLQYLEEELLRREDYLLDKEKTLLAKERKFREFIREVSKDISKKLQEIEDMKIEWVEKQDDDER